MKYFVKFFVITLIALTCTYAKADSANILYIDLKIVLNESKAGKEAQDYLKKEAEKNIKRFKKTEDELKKKETELISKKKILTKEEYKKMAEKLRKDVQSYQVERQELMQKVSKQRSVGRSELIETLKIILENYSKENNVSVIMNKKDVLYADPKLDITNNIIKILNKELPSVSLQ